MDFIEVLKAVLFGIVEGITEWLPISSTGHLILLEEWCPLATSKEFFQMFLVVIQFGAILAVVVSFFHKMNPFGRKPMKQKREITQNWIKVIIGCIPAGVFGVLLNDWFDEHLSDPMVVAVALIVYGILFLLLENRNQDRNFQINRLGQLSYIGALTIGMIQVLALVPGTSRSGATILGAMLLGVARPVAAEFSFYLSVPVMCGASLLKLLHFGFAFTQTEIVLLLAGTLMAFLVSMAAIKLFMDYVRTHDFRIFGYYRILLGIVVIAYFVFLDKTPAV
ncbi:MAG: undecaprenyl-diphosphate phosphatase [Lachnospiraceae bacterium]|nr:undecaprenyl-diphosphate phosphatase [Lachnospiraceae bacterium]